MVTPEVTDEREMLISEIQMKLAKSKRLIPKNSVQLSQQVESFLEAQTELHIALKKLKSMLGL